MTHVITSTDARGNRFFHAGEGRWSDERPDAFEYRTKWDALKVIKLYRTTHYGNRTWAVAVVEGADA